MTELVHYDVARAIATITLDSPRNRNALSSKLTAELTGYLEAAAKDDDVRAIVLTHTGGTFCAGADLTEAKAEGMEQGTRRLLALLRQVLELPKPVVARVDGHVRAGGVGLIGACDLVLAGPKSTFAFTEVRLGLAPAIISLTTRSRLGERAASRYYLTGEAFDVATAARIGLVTEAAEDLDPALETVLAGLRKGSPQGLRETKPLTTRRLLAAFDAEGEALVARSAQLFASEEAREGMTAFLERRRPRWDVDA
jgi:enoyl-CoA hydratase